MTKQALPTSQQGLTAYITYAKEQIKKNLRHNDQLEKWIGICDERLDKYKKPNERTP